MKISYWSHTLYDLRVGNSNSSQKVKFCVKWLNSLLHFLPQNHCLPTARHLSSLPFLISPDVHVELSNLVSVLARCRNLYCTCPVKVKVTQSVRQMLYICLWQIRVVLSHLEMSWQHTTLSCRCWCQEKIKLLTSLRMTFYQTFVDDATWWRIMQLASAVLNKETLRNSFVHYHHSYFWLSCNLVVQKIYCCLKLRNLARQYLIALSITYTVSKDYEVSWKLILMVFSKWLDCLTYRLLHVVLNNLLTFLLDQEIAVVLAHLLIDWSWKANNWLWTSMTYVDSDQHSALFVKCSWEL